ncbi:uncharacterized protein TrAtP1_009426 [Trichoderma atroviride]|uniref:uncharacterized protein n=1 Tax=Hypocrea atroviridis TaxID=63577 RepID=UPI003316796A|nr:hypothetical protein TrAtP1_009426 [Trichoderma atroviride]
MDGHGCRNTTNVRATLASDNGNSGHPHSPHRDRQGYLAARDIIPRPAAPGPIDLESQAINSLYEEPFFSSDEYADFSSTSTSTSSQSSPGTSFEHPDWQYADWARIIPARYVHYEEPERPDQKGCWQWGLIVLFVVALGSIGGVIVAVHH